MKYRGNTLDAFKDNSVRVEPASAQIVLKSGSLETAQFQRSRHRAGLRDLSRFIIHIIL